MDKKQRAGKLEREAGTARPDPDLAKLSDEQLLRLYERERSGEAEAERQRAATERDDPVFGYLKNLTDEELIAEYNAATAELAAQAAELERRRPSPPEPVPEPEPVTEPHPIEPHAVVLEEQPKPTPQPTSPGAHVSDPVEGCGCMLCETHRQLVHQEEQDRALAQRYEHEPLVEGSVRVAPSATAEFAAAMRGNIQR